MNRIWKYNRKISLCQMVDPAVDHDVDPAVHHVDAFDQIMQVGWEVKGVEFDGIQVVEFIFVKSYHHFITTTFL